MDTSNFRQLSRDEMKTIKGGTGGTCATDAVACNPKCGHFTTSYDTFASCMDVYNVPGCSPLAEWEAVCGNYN